MSTLHITELSRLAIIGDATSKAIPVAPLNAVVAVQEVTIGAETDSAALNVATRFIRVKANAACAIKEGSVPTATTGDLPLDAGETEYFGVTPGEKISVIARTP